MGWLEITGLECNSTAVWVHMMVCNGVGWWTELSEDVHGLNSRWNTWITMSVFLERPKSPPHHWWGAHWHTLRLNSPLVYISVHGNNYRLRPSVWFVLSERKPLNSGCTLSFSRFCVGLIRNCAWFFEVPEYRRIKNAVWTRVSDGLWIRKKGLFGFAWFERLGPGAKHLAASSAFQLLTALPLLWLTGRPEISRSRY